MAVPYLDFWLTEEAMDFLWDIINTEKKNPTTDVHEVSGDARHYLAGNISKSVYVQDKDNWFFENVLKELTEHMYFANWNTYYEVKISKSKPPPEFKLKALWVNYQKQYEFNPPHTHADGEGWSFVVFMKIPTHWKEQHALPISANSNMPSASDFQFLLGHGMGPGTPGPVQTITIQLSSDEEGRILFFPAWLAHQVMPFYNTEEERITISGNIFLAEGLTKTMRQDEADILSFPKDKVKKDIERMQEKIDKAKTLLKKRMEDE